MKVEERILVKGVELFFTKGVKSVTMDDIAHSLGVSKKTIYQHYTDKKMLVNAVTEFALSKEICKEEEYSKLASNPIEEIILATKQMREMFSNISPTLLYDLQKYYPSAFKHYLSHKKDFKEVVLRNMRQGVDQGYYRKDIHVEVLATLRIESVDLAFDNTVFPANRFNLLDVQLAFIDHFLRGIMTEKGLRVYEAIK